MMYSEQEALGGRKDDSADETYSATKVNSTMMMCIACTVFK